MILTQNISKFSIAVLIFGLFLFSTEPIQAQKRKKKGAAAEESVEDRLKLEGIYIRANQAVILEELDEAKKLFNEVLSLDANHGPALFELGRVYYEEKNDQAALEFAQRAVDADPKNKWYSKLFAECLANNHEYKRAAEVYEALKKEDPQNIDHYFDQAFMYRSAKEYEKAIAVMDELERLVGPDEILLLEKQKMYMQLNEVDKAAAEIRKLIAAYPNKTNYYNLLAELYTVNKREAEAQKVYAELMNVDPQNPFGQLARAEEYKKAGDVEGYQRMMIDVFGNTQLAVPRKIQMLMSKFPPQSNIPEELDFSLRLSEAMVKAHPEESRVHAVRGDLLYNSGKLAQALLEYREAINLDPNSLPIWEQIFFLDADMGNHKQLINDTKAAIELFPNSALPYYFNGIGQNRSGNYEKAIKSLKRALVIGDQNKTLVADIYSQIGDTYNSMGEHEKSDEHFEKALEIEPNNAIVLNNYSYYLSQRNDRLEAAEKMSRKTIDLVPNNPSFLDTYGWILFQMGRYKEAEDYLKRAIDNNGDRPVIVEHYGDALKQSGNVAEAIEQYKRAIGLGGNKTLLQQKIDESKP